MIDTDLYWNYVSWLARENLKTWDRTKIYTKVRKWNIDKNLYHKNYKNYDRTVSWLLVLTILQGVEECN